MKKEVKEILISMGIVETAITEKAHLMYDLGLDSLDVTEFVMLVEEKFKIAIPDSAQEKIATVGDLFAYLEANTKVALAT
ncbi:acyl carrier protein [Thermoflexibacter ruber]|uniref:Acyl carrier protein n=1 Tax=Thermoflexibacter ruber TaxID=1003 RepID=A0A1I2FGH3_9BACT|nr:acyl carrier protein [Thermoflexibacter ruber]SFF03561.1 acyl carrier protein [Thermoflexibacter ruber]